MEFGRKKEKTEEYEREGTATKEREKLGLGKKRSLPLKGERKGKAGDVGTCSVRKSVPGNATPVRISFAKREP